MSRPFGFEFSPCSNNVNAVVTRVAADSGAFAKGVREGDLILGINDHDLRGREFGEYLCLIRSLPTPVSIQFVHARPEPYTSEETRLVDNRAMDDKIVEFNRRPFGLVFWTDESNHNAIVVGKYPRMACSESDFDLISTGDMVCNVNGDSVVNWPYFKIKALLETCDLPVKIEFKPVILFCHDVSAD